ncbi:MAG: secretin N-terminal domain-containing protein [Candidatus Ratteibacteria bacterium]|nr:secretin N-terminal domain-containing protein [Candidatus Ratteibacteria bacterium]
MRNLILSLFISLVLFLSSPIFAQDQTSDVMPTSESKITLDLKNVKLEDALRLITEKTGMKFVIKADLSGKLVSIYLPDVEGRDALDAILSMHGLDYTRRKDTDIYIVEEMPETLPLEIDVVPLKYAKAKEVGEIIKSNLSPHGQVSVDVRTNTVIIRDLPKNIIEVEDLIGKLDRSLSQVLIRADIVELSTDATRELGVEWEVGITASGAVQQTTFPFYTDEATTFRKLEQVYNETGGWAELEGDVPTFTFGQLSFADLSASIKALETKGLAKVLAQPRIAVQNDHSANINIINHIAVAIKTTYDEVGNIVREPIYGDIGVELNTTPHITDDGDVILEVEPSVTSAAPSPFFAEAVDTTKRSAKTIITVKDEGTVVIGGLLRSENSTTITKVPFLGNIPLLGLLFRSTDKSEERTDLVVFISPIILTEEKIAKVLQEDRTTIKNLENTIAPSTSEKSNKGYLTY